MKKKKILLALQGGGAFGAFTWGVLDRLLEEENLEIAAVSGTSAGAVNASLLGYGLTIGDRQTAREKLDLFWRKMADWGFLSLFQPTWLDKVVSRGNMDYNPFYESWGILSSFLSPYQFNPFDLKHAKGPKFEVTSNRPTLTAGSIKGRPGQAKAASEERVSSNILFVRRHQGIGGDTICSHKCLLLKPMSTSI